MVFSSITFLFFFLPVFFLFYYSIPFRNVVLLAGSLLFYAWGDPARLPLLLAYIVLNWGFGLMARNRAAVACGIAANLALLVYFKYAGFLLRQVDIALSASGLPVAPVPTIVLPLGISFFAFQGISYLVDIHRGLVAPQRSLFAYATYKAMFPPLIAGPIVRYKTIAGSLRHRAVDQEEIRAGIILFAIGLGQKVLLANAIAGPVDQVFALPIDRLSLQGAWLGAVGFALQIYFDFNGYTNMALGLGRMLGFTLPPNFDLPYSARSMTDFWRRWHISLSTWFRDYLYIPLGGNRSGSLRTAINLLAVFVLCGLWHGAAWTFAIWGLYHGLFLALERIGLAAWLARCPRLIQHLYLLTVVVVGWVPFRAPSLAQAWRYLGAMVGWAGPALPLASFVTPSVAAALMVGGVLSVWRPSRSLLSLPMSAPLQQAGCLVLVILSAARLAAGTYNPFIYFRF
jgi:alginate O-acetyltransferase complex protein AlgI